MTSDLPPNERPPRRDSRLSGPALGGAVLIVLGLYFLLQTFGVLDFFSFWRFNVWALFLLIPAAILAYNAWQTYQANGEQINREVRSKAIGAILLGLLFVGLFWKLDWSLLWPVFLIVGGLAALLGALGSRSE